MDNYQLILDDLQQENPLNPSILPPFYNDYDTPTDKIKLLLRQLRRTKSLKDRIGMLLNAWYIGEVIETMTSSPLQRTLCMNLLTPYYQRAIIKTFYLFETLGVEQIGRTRQLTLAMVYKTKQREHGMLVTEATTIAGARL